MSRKPPKSLIVVIHLQKNMKISENLNNQIRKHFQKYQLRRLIQAVMIHQWYLPLKEASFKWSENRGEKTVLTPKVVEVSLRPVDFNMFELFTNGYK